MSCSHLSCMWKTHRVCVSQTSHQCGTGNLYLHSETKPRNIINATRGSREQSPFLYVTSKRQPPPPPPNTTHTLFIAMEVNTDKYIKDFLHDVDTICFMAGSWFPKISGIERDGLFALLIGVNDYQEIKHRKNLSGNRHPSLIFHHHWQKAQWQNKSILLDIIKTMKSKHYHQGNRLKWL